MVVMRCLSALLLLGFATGVQAQEVTDIHIGVVAPLSGPFEPLGRQVQAGVALALEGQEGVTVTAIDDACDEATGRAAGEALVEAGVDIVVGGVCWRPANAARDVLGFADIPFVASGVRYQSFTDEADGDVFRLSGRDDAQGGVLASAILDGPLDGLVGGVAREQSLALFYTDGNYGRALAESVLAALEAQDVSLAINEAFTPQDDLAALAERVGDAALVIILAGQADTALLADALPETPILAADSVMSADFALLSARSGEGVVFARPTPWRTLVDPDVLTDLEGEDEGSMAGIILPSMAATQVALGVLEGDDPPYETVLGPIMLDENGDADVPDFQLWQWRDGRIWPFEPDAQVN